MLLFAAAAAASGAPSQTSRAVRHRRNQALLSFNRSRCRGDACDHAAPPAALAQRVDAVLVEAAQRAAEADLLKEALVLLQRRDVVAQPEKLRAIISPYGYDFRLFVHITTHAYARR